MAFSFNVLTFPIGSGLYTKRIILSAVCVPIRVSTSSYCGSSGGNEAEIVSGMGKENVNGFSLASNGDGEMGRSVCVVAEIGGELPTTSVNK
jgi:hypothetical protein